MRSHAKAARPTAGVLRGLLVAAVVPLAMMGLASPALAKSPTGIFAVFGQCPRFTTGVSKCIYAQTESGEVVLNKQRTPIVNTTTLQGGSKFNETTGKEEFVGALNGETLSKTPQKVPGGLAGLMNCTELSNSFERKVCEAIFENRLTGLYATTELALPASDIGISNSNLINREGVALSLPVKIHLENPLLGSECYVGSASSPVTWNLTTGVTSPNGPNKPIEGKVGTPKFEDNFNFVEIKENSIVDNAYSAPEATGCGGFFSFLLDPIINGKIGLPSADGHNTTVLSGTLRQATAKAVIESEA